MKSKQTVMGKSFQINTRTGGLLFGGDPFKENANRFWQTWPGKCLYYCGSEKVIIVEMRTVNNNQQMSTGISIFIRKENKCWYESATISKKEIESCGGIVDSPIGLPDKIRVNYKNGEVREYKRLDLNPPI